MILPLKEGGLDVIDPEIQSKALISKLIGSQGPFSWR